MPKQPTAKQLKALYQKKMDFIDKSLKGFDADMRRLETELFDMLITDYVSRLVVKDGVIVSVLESEKNGRILAELDKVMTQFKTTFADGTFAKLGENMLKMTDLTSDYFRAMTGSKKIIEGITTQLDKYRLAVGLDAKGNIIKGSFLDNLATAGQLKTALSDYMQKSVMTGADMKTFVTGLKDLVKGKDGVNGAMEQYVGQYAKSSFLMQGRVQDNFFSEQLGIEYWVWEGELIKTSRPICIKNHGKVFSKEQLLALNDKNWEGKIPGVDIFMQVGGYGPCRHMLRPVTDVGAEQMGFDPSVSPDEE